MLGVLMIALRRSAYGRRLTAMKNSPAACATLGMNVVRLKLSVFMISAAIAGLGGCLFAQEIGAVTGDRFSLFESMTMLMLLVVAGAGYVSGGLDRRAALRRGRSSRSRTSSPRSAQNSRRSTG